jgi:hypothetical protein
VTNGYIEMIGSTRQQAFSIPPSPQTRYSLGLASTTKVSRTDTGRIWNVEGSCFYALRFEVFWPTTNFDRG